MKICPNCGTQSKELDAFCTQCGEKLEENRAEDTGEIDLTRAVDSDYDFGNQHDTSSNPFDPTPQNNMSTPIIPDGTRGDTIHVDSAPQGVISGNIPHAHENTRKNSIALKIAIAVAAVAIIAVIALVVPLAINNSSAKGHTVKFEAGGGTQIKEAHDEGSGILSPKDPERTGYEFEGWYIDRDCTEKAQFPFVPTEDTVLYAKWREVDKTSGSQPAQQESAESASANQPYSSANQQGYNTVQVVIPGVDGTTRKENIRRRGSSERVLPDSNSRLYSYSEISGLTDAEKCIAWNEIVASSNGYAFRNQGLASYFDKCSWYRCNPGASIDGNLPEGSTAKRNIYLLQEACSDSWYKEKLTN